MELLLQPVEVIEMDIKRMHCMIEKLSECAKSEMESGIENVDTCEMGKVVDMMKDLSEAMYYRTLTKAMDESTSEETIEMFERYGDGRRFYDKYRYADGRFAPKGRGTRRGYEEQPYYHMNPDMYREHEPEYWRDMDRKDGKMYYTEPITMESRYDKAKRMYTETKAKHNSGSVEDKQLTLKEGEKMINVIIDELMEMVSDATPEMKNMIKTKGMSAMQKIQ